MHGDAISVLVMRLSRPHASGAWFAAHGDEREDLAPGVCGRVHGVRLRDGDGADPQTPPRYVRAAGAL